MLVWLEVVALDVFCGFRLKLPLKGVDAELLLVAYACKELAPAIRRKTLKNHLEAGWLWSWDYGGFPLLWLGVGLALAWLGAVCFRDGVASYCLAWRCI